MTRCGVPRAVAASTALPRCCIWPASGRRQMRRVRPISLHRRSRPASWCADARSSSRYGILPGGGTQLKWELRHRIHQLYACDAAPRYRGGEPRLGRVAAGCQTLAAQCPGQVVAALLLEFRAGPGMQQTTELIAGLFPSGDTVASSIGDRAARGVDRFPSRCRGTRACW